MLGQIIDLLEAKDIDWEDVARLCHDYRTEPAVYYVLAAVKELCGAAPPEGWLEMLKTSFSRRGHLHDFGPLWAPLLRLERDEILSISLS